MRSSFLEAVVLAASNASFTSEHCSRIVSLVGNDWTLTNPSLNITVPASLPSQAHLDLYNNQVIGDPYYGLNNFNLRWVAWSDWSYKSCPIIGLSEDSESTWLVFDGLDTFASVFLCSRYVGSTENQFKQYYFDVTEIVQACPQADRILELHFGSAPKIADAIATNSNLTWPAGVQQVYQFPNRWFIRKEQSDFGWDWGPAFAPAGPWQPARVVQLGEEQVYVRNSIIDIHRQNQLNLLPPDQTQPWVINAGLDLLGPTPVNATMRYELTHLDNKTVIAAGNLANVSTAAASVKGSTTIPCDAVDLWWPSGMGPQALYYLRVSLISRDNHTLATIAKRVGFRTIVLNELPISDAQLAQGIAAGNNWHFEINGHEFYAKGSNFIPPDAFWPRVTVEKVDMLFDSVIAGNQNMLRVWASGAYSPDWLYDLADEKGILLWSEFEFGDALYPTDAAFLENVRQEAEYQVRRVNHHPSLCLWAGGNELENLELMLVNNTAPEQLARFTAEYEKLFLDTLAPVVFGNSKSISYTPSSTSNGWSQLNFSNSNPITERYSNLTAGSVYGETDFYNYDPSALYNDSALPIGRFSNEFGFHSMPSIQSWRQQVSEADLQFNSSVVMLRNQHNPAGGLNTSNYANSAIGQGQMTRAVEMWFPVPNKTDSAANFSAWSHATQLYQADLYRSEIQFYRRGSGLPNRQLGSLYWQLNDIWVAPTWASIEYDGRWKVVHYATKDVYEPVIIAPYYDRETGNLSIWATSDLWEDISGRASFAWYDWSGNVIETTMPAIQNFQVGAINSTELYQGFIQNFTTNPDRDNMILHMELGATGRMPNSNVTQEFRHENWFHPGSLRDAAVVNPGLQLSYSEQSKNFTVTATTGIGAWIWLDYPAGAVLHFDTNAFWLAPNTSRQIGYTVRSDTTGGKWVEQVTVQSLYNLTVSE